MLNIKAHKIHTLYARIHLYTQNTIWMATFGLSWCYSATLRPIPKDALCVLFLVSMSHFPFHIVVYIKFSSLLTHSHTHRPSTTFQNTRRLYSIISEMQCLSLMHQLDNLGAGNGCPAIWEGFAKCTSRRPKTHTPKSQLCAADANELTHKVGCVSYHPPPSIHPKSVFKGRSWGAAKRVCEWRWLCSVVTICCLERCVSAFSVFGEMVG